MKKKLFSLSLLLFSLLFISAQSPTPTSWSVKSEKLVDNKYNIIISSEIEDGWHLYSQYLKSNEGPLSTFIQFDIGSTNSLIDSTTEEGVVTHFDPVWEMDISYFENKAKFIQTIAVSDTTQTLIKGNVNFMVCDEKECLPPDDYNFEINLSSGIGGQQEVIYKTDSSTLAVIPSLPLLDLNSPINNNCGDIEEQDKSFWMLLIFGFLGGLISLFTPCVFPMVPLTVSFFTKGGSEKGSGIGKALLYGFSIILVYVSLSLPFYIQGTDPEVLNKIASGAILNVIFFIIFLVFAFSFFGFYELTLPSSWANKADKAADIGGVVGVIFMALVLAIVSFSCTGPLLGSVLAGSLDKGPVPITMAMLGFGVGLGLPFTIFAAFPSMLKSLPQSGGWLNSVKVVLGFVELALAFKFLSTADLVEHWGILKYEAFLIIWILCAIGTALYLFGKIKFPHDSPISKLKPTRIALASLFVITAVYFSFGFRLNDKTGTYQSLNLLSGVAPPVTYCWAFPNECPNGLNCFHDFESAQAYAKEVNLPILIDFTGHACTNCRRMEDNVWSKKEVFNLINDNYVLASLYVDDREELPIDLQGEVTINMQDGTKKQKKIITTGDKWATFEARVFEKVSQPFYVLISPNGKLLTNPVSYTPDYKEYASWLECGVEAFNKIE
ncbi:protein-disulfide reductase DsbD family protein [Flavobacteriales bacterium]|nr:protein-disulfide reductase DsbD family protein [Flavobacteriales bacterium]